MDEREMTTEERKEAIYESIEIGKNDEDFRAAYDHMKDQIEKAGPEGQLETRSVGMDLINVLHNEVAESRLGPLHFSISVMAVNYAVMAHQYENGFLSERGAHGTGLFTGDEHQNENHEKE